jgi:hypothetical protein
VQHSVKLYGLAVTSKLRKRNVNVKKENKMGHGIGPQNLGAAGMSSKSKPCGTPLAFNAKLEAAVDSGKITGKFANLVKANS